eukprot:TRINITY_DN2622_c0_g2_i1.p1 TRINITY_DN2622_c0_g2~~TRINITY_DN2622_c0_g2_i1.p1  ORF type:complete len:696 (-),score=67.14 TRINITY_DN2622_c0_g2_i1:27-2114(-)
MAEAELAQLYSDLVSVPSPQSAWLLPSDAGLSRVIAKFSQADLKNDKGRTFVTDFVRASVDHAETFSASVPNELVDVHIYLPSPSGKHVAVVRSKPNPNAKPGDSPTFFLEIWSGNRLKYNISTAGKHAHIYNDEWFGGLEWSLDESRLAYAAEPEPPKSASFWADDKPADPQPLKGHQYDLIEDWGETYQNKAHSRLYVVDLASQSIVAAPGVPDNLSIGQVSWAPDSRTLAYVGWPIDGRRLGIKYCYNRRSAIYTSTIGANISADISPAVHISRDDLIARSPRFSPDGRRLVWLASQETRTHNTCCSLRMLELESQVTTTVVDVVDVLPSLDAFPGLFVGLLPSRCFLSANEIVLDSQWHSRKVLLQIDLRSTNKVDRLQAESRHGSFTALDVRPAQVVAVTSAINQLPQIILGSKSGNAWTWTPVSEVADDPIVAKVSAIKWDVVTLGVFPDIFQYISVQTPQDVSSPPLLVSAHGGPHSAFSTDYMNSIAFMCLSGFSAIFINYRGSLGFGKALVDALPGHIGELDVNDCIQSIEHRLSAGQVDSGKIVYIGGSHGGYLGGQLCGRTSYFKAAALRNPVTNLLSLVGSSDIPDWALVESGASTRFEIERLNIVSPISLIGSNQTPTLFLVGDSDRRVPPSQPFDMYYALRDRGVPTEMKLYPKTGHAISKPELDADSNVNAVLWFKKYTK